jgi:hypothetical protein
MTEHSRRNFVRNISLQGAAIGALAVAPSLLEASSATASTGQAVEPAPRAVAAPHGEPIVAYVRDAATGEIAVLCGEHEVVHRDQRLAAHLTRIAASARNT